MPNEIKQAYNSGAKEYRRQYDGILPRQTDVDLALSYVAVDQPMVLEIGCAYGREAAYILTKTNRYWY
jgi:hypothetical protein